MPSAADARRLLNEITAHFAQPDWSDVQAWLQQSSGADRTVSQHTLPMGLNDLSGGDPSLAPGDQVPNAVLLRAATATLPAGSQYDAPVFALGDVVVEEGVRLAHDLVVQGTLTWRGGESSYGRNISADTLRLEQAGHFDGGLWCERLEGGIPANSRVRGIVVVSGATATPLTVGAGTHLGGLHTAGDVTVGNGAQISQILSGGEVVLGPEVRIGTLRAASVRIGPRSRVARAESDGALTIEAEAVVDSAEAAGDLHIGRDARLTGHTLVSKRGDIYADESERWHSNGRHWFYRLADGTLSPYDRTSRPDGSSVVALRTLTHALWEQTMRLTAPPQPSAPVAAAPTPTTPAATGDAVVPPAQGGGARVIEAVPVATAAVVEADDDIVEAVDLDIQESVTAPSDGARVIEGEPVSVEVIEGEAPAPADAVSVGAQVADDAVTAEPDSAETVLEDGVADTVATDAVPTETLAPDVQPPLIEPDPPAPEEAPPTIGTIARPEKRPKSRRRR